MSARELFESIRSERREMQEVIERIEELELIASGARAIQLKPVVAHTNKTGSSLEDAAIKVIELQLKLTNQERKLLQDILDAEEIIAQIKNSEYRRVITAYYITGNNRRRMVDIARQIPCGEATAWRCFRKGMDEAERIYKKRKVDRK